ncbi:MAG: PD40 domain-containing protein [Caldilineaceae bacterium]|nr:PD40 domain-containing protein [Caldilineaceae bacterium]
MLTIRKHSTWGSISAILAFVLIVAGCVPTARLLVGVGAEQASQQADLLATPMMEPATQIPTEEPTEEPTATNTSTPAPTPTNTATTAPTATNTPTTAPTATNTPTPEPTATNTPTPEPTATNTPMPEPTATNTPMPEPTATNTPMPEPTATNTATTAPTATNTPMPEPTATNTPMPEPTATATPMLEAEAIRVRVVQTSVNLRGGPGTTFPIVGNAVAGAEFPILGRNEAGDWYLIDRGAGLSSWIFAQLVTVLGDVSTIPVADDIPVAPSTGGQQTGTVATQPAAQPIAPGTVSGRLLYSLANMDADRWELWEYNFATGSSNKVADWRTEVDISKDGNQIAYYAWAGDVGAQNEGIWIMDGNFANNREVIGGGAYPSFSPGGDRLSFNGGADIYVINTDGKGLRRLTRGEYGSWSPVNDEIVHRACVGGGCGLYAINANSEDANAKRRLTEGGSDGQPAWSPEGSQIAYISQEDGNFEVYIINADGSGKVRLTNDLASDGLPVWSPDGQWIAFRSDRGGNWAIYIVRPDGSNLRKVTDANVLDRWFFEKMDWRR